MSIINYDKATKECCKEYELSKVFMDKLFYSPCNSVFDGVYTDYHGEPKHQNKTFVAVPSNSPLIDFDSILDTVKPLEGDIYCRKFLRGNHEIIFFVNADKPSDWYGFVAFKVEDNNTDTSKSYSITHLLTYVKPEYRGDQMGITLSGMAGWIISESLRYPREGDFKNIHSFSLDVSGQGCHDRGRDCLESFSNGCNFLISSLEDDAEWEDDIYDNITYSFNFEDEY